MWLGDGVWFEMLRREYSPWRSEADDARIPNTKTGPAKLRGLSVPRSSIVRKITQRYCNVTSTWITPSPLGSGWRALPSTAPIIFLRLVPFMA